MTRFFRFSVLVLATWIAMAAATPAAPDKVTTEQIISRLTVAIENLKTLRCVIKAQERFGASYQSNQTALKLAYNPQRVYLRNKKGIEVLWVAGQNDGDAWVYPNSFPYVTLSLDPNGTLMRRNQHHSLIDAGYGVVADIIHGSALRQDHNFERSFRYTGDTIVQNRPCYILTSDYAFRYVSYKTVKGDTPARVADRFGCGEFRVLERNGLTPGQAIPEGKTLQVPNAYGRHTVLCIDQKMMLPLAVYVADDKGLFEQFSFSEVVANQPIAPEEFTKDYKGYKL
ncbi:DUF1571 domain-containing protein [Hymenobacter sp. GOD-10R]|uniref:LysM peptidoglycan-binding domain-containing protein n=1 Tax=Hymenobacter sp. GOD-10R TaxID=3093922 RepID=UPI002D783916|nr:DUF1571 domain-containing protein [Hymenobacter sp. GOD-10R]WRQ30885.1 DUF1571 domain-containing protein [Hymenobacter sp. GOD-10R]